MSEFYDTVDGRMLEGVVLVDPNTGKASTGAGAVVQVVPDFRVPQDLLNTYNNFSEVNWAGGDFVTRVSTSNGQAITALSVNPLIPGESRVSLNVPVRQPAAFEVEASVVRNRQQFATLTLYSNGIDGLPSPTPDPINIISISQSTATAGAAYTGSAGTVVTVLLETALPEYPSEAAVYLSDWINITGLVDSRLNYQNACISYISPDRKTITFGFSDDSALPSLAIPVVTPTLGTAKVNFYNNLGGAAEGFGLRFTGIVTTAAAIVSVLGAGDAQVSGALLGDHRVYVGSSVPQYLNGIWGQCELKATSRYRLEARAGEAVILDKAIESPLTVWSARVARTAVKPSVHLPLYPRMRVYQPVGMSRPVAKVVSVSKNASATATVTTDVAHGLVVGNVITVYGVRDTTNFANLTTTVTAVLSSTQFQCVFGASATATSYGGMVSTCNGGAGQPGVVSQVVSTVANLTANPEWLSIVGSTTWSGLSIGDYVNTYGVRGSAGEDLLLDGAWEVAHLSASTLILKPIYDLLGNRQSPVTPTLSGTVNAGGAIILRTTARVHDLMLEEWSENKVMIDGQGTNRADKAIPVYPTNTFPVAGSTAIDGALSPTGGALPIAARAQTANPTAVSASADAVYALATMIGALIQKPYCIPEAEWSFTFALTTTSDVAIQAAAGVGLKRHVTLVQATNTGASAVDVIIKDGSTVRLQFTVPAGQNVVMPLPTGIPLTANTALNAALSAAGTVRLNALGYTAP